ncbi:MAG: twin-arginine translocation signal domain-containing protein [Verrucomicrobiota bacterium]
MKTATRRHFVQLTALAAASAGAGSPPA